MTTSEVADQLVQLCKDGKFLEAVKTLYADDVVSVEAMAAPGQSREMQGLDKVIGKGEWWTANHEVHSSVVEGPLVAGSTFCVRFKMDVTSKPMGGTRMQMDELGVYHVKNGKVSREEFFYSM